MKSVQLICILTTFIIFSCGRTSKDSHNNAKIESGTKNKYHQKIILLDSTNNLIYSDKMARQIGKVYLEYKFHEEITNVNDLKVSYFHDESVWSVMTRTEGLAYGGYFTVDFSSVDGKVFSIYGSK
jgi:hypothetical protein